MVNIIQDFIPAGRRNRPGKQNALKYVTIHNTGNNGKGAGAKNHAAYIKGDDACNLPASWHYTVDDSVIYQHLPDKETAYHAGDNVGNTQSIGIEICMNSDGDLRKATDNAVELTAALCKAYNIPLDKVVQHNVWWGKDCPQMLRQGKPYTWEAFLQKVKVQMEPAPVPTPVPPKEDAVVKDEPSEWAKTACEKVVQNGLIKGDGAGWYGWKDPVTLERMLVILNKLGLLK